MVFLFSFLFISRRGSEWVVNDYQKVAEYQIFDQEKDLEQRSSFSLYMEKAYHLNMYLILFFSPKEIDIFGNSETNIHMLQNLYYVLTRMYSILCM